MPLRKQLFCGVLLSSILYRRVGIPTTSTVFTHIARMATNGSSGGVTIDDLPKSHVFTSKLPADSLFPTAEDSDKAPRKLLGPRQVREALFTWVRPEDEEDDPELLAVSPRAMKDIGLKPEEENSEKFRNVVAGKEFYREHYPWAQCYGGYQFGQWAGQLGDGRAISLFEATNPATGKRWEIQLKGAGRTPYSRFADGKAVVRSSIREFIVSEALNALGIPTTRALSLTLLPNTRAIRERIEPAAIVCRFAPTWIRFGTFDLLRMRGDRVRLRQLADYVIEEVYGGVEKLVEPREGETSVNRYERLYREVVRRNAKTVAHWQAYGFMNGVLNTDNTSILGLSLDFGPFAFMDNFDPYYTPNHDDHALRYSYRNQTTIIWWNLVRLGEDLAELFGAEDVDDPEIVENGIKDEDKADFIKRAEGIIERAGLEYKSVFMENYKILMTKRLGLQTQNDADVPELLSSLLDTMEEYELDFNNFFRRLSSIPAQASPEEYLKLSEQFLHPEGAPVTQEPSSIFANKPSGNPASVNRDKAQKAVAAWLEIYNKRLQAEDNLDDVARAERMNAANPKFVPRGWVLQEVIERVEKKGEREILKKVLNMALNPFQETWDGDEWEERFCADPPRVERAIQCSCSS